MDEVLEAAAAPPPTLLADRYQLLEVIGRGGMAEVYRAADLKLDRFVAVKMLLDGAGDQSERERFIAEAKTLAMLSHGGLVTVLDAGFGVSGRQRAVVGAVELDQPFLVMELVDGPTLATLMREGPLAPDELRGIAIQVADALRYVHDRGIVHRDVKPANVLVGDRDQVKLADFGIARLVEQRTRHTGTGMAIGTAAYVAPEQVSGGHVDGAADIYSLGLVLLEALTGRREYAGAPAEAALARLNRPPAVPALPVWNGLLTAMTALEPADRPSAGEVVSLLRDGPGHAPAPVPGVAGSEAGREGDPVLATAAYDVSSAEGFAPSGPRTALWRRPSTDSVVLGAVAAAFLLLFIVTALVRAGDAGTTLPANTPDHLREPLAALHDAVGGDDAEPALASALDDVDTAIEGQELAAARTAVEDLIEETAEARDTADVGEDQAEEIFAAAAALLAQLPESDEPGGSVGPEGE